MRVLQLIDSLEAGGAERMAVNYANGLANRIAFSALAVTRKQGILKEQLDKAVSYTFLERKRTVDFKAVSRLKRFVKDNSIDIIHAHGTSYFIAVMLKIAYPKIKIVWHDHHGGRSSQKGYKNAVLKMTSRFFDTVMVVNQELKAWAERNLAVAKVIYLPNFAVRDKVEEKQTTLKGTDGKRIVCLSNLRYPKNHALLLEAFRDSGLHKKEWSLHLIGKDSQDDYSSHLKRFISDNRLDDSIFIYGSCSDISNVLEQGTIGVLASVFEGFPVTLLEYGMAGLAVVSTNVGYCSEIIQNEKTGLSFTPSDVEMLTAQLKRMADDQQLRKSVSEALKTTIRESYSEEIVMNALILQYQNILNAKQK
ncbi:MAG: alpha-1,4-N-acetylgalactosamine transferase [Flavobacterium sp. 38-13]|uniref:glycosyltransferase n=1 Tax=Flavobacterium sp. 38-13 TaxID=1896168 RepID=UPI00095C60F6|nr:glycosyltransferase [Flavobacterium sp. 38-13]OJX49454.1 MAG: alpha-1,4-N-acetylgalactosamine transferase [Flavobacterium sp. 38-13]